MKAALAALLVASPALAQEDAAHRADRLRTEALNRNADDAVAGRDRANARERARYAAAHADYQRRLAEWRHQVADCENGDRSAC